MRRTTLAALAILLAWPIAASAQQTDSLAEAARKAREQKKNAPKSAKVFDNDNVPKGANFVSVIGEAAPSTAESSAAANAGGAAVGGNKKDETKKEGEAYWRERFAKARGKIQQAQTELDILQREMSQLQLQYYPDPTKAMQQQYSRSDIVKKQAKIAEKQKQIQQLQQDVSDLEDELRRAGGDPGWARE